MVIYPESFSVKPNTEATIGFRNLFNTTSQSAINKNLTLLKGNYVFCSKNADERKIYVSNSTAPEEYSKLSKRDMHKTAIVIENIKNMEIDCGGSNFIMDGKMSHIYIKNCENIKFKNLNIETVLPDVHKITITKASPFYITFEIDSQSNYIEENGEFYWVGTDYKTGFADFKNSAYWTPTAKKDNLFHLTKNGSHPLYGVSGLKQVTDRVFNARYIVPKDFENGQVFYIFSAIRDEVGILVEDSKNIHLENIKQTFNYSHAFIAQNSENITLQGVRFSPNPKAEADFCSFADAVHFSMCRGKIKVCDSTFDAVASNACNIHGFHFKITDINKDKMTVRFSHPKSYGFNCLRTGDIIAFIDPKTLAEKGRTKLLHAELRDEYYFDLVLTTYDAPASVGDYIECIPANADFEFSGNTMNRIAGKGVVCTTRGKVRIENNKFLNTGSAGVLFAGDTTEKFEGGRIQDAYISGNAFMNCEESNILVKPLNRKHLCAIHKNILIENNLFITNNIHVASFTSCENVVMKNNVYKGKALSGKWVVEKNTENIITDCPKQK